MAGLGKTLDYLNSLRQRFEASLATAGQKLPRTEVLSQGSRRLREIPDFGTNPGNLRLLTYAPERLPRMPALVVVLHGCTQTAEEYDYGSGWSALADRLGFVVIYPEQQPSNNPQKCFSWFLPGDTTRQRGEARSIRQMIERAIMDFGVDRRRVFVTGLSAGGAMTSVMLATYPEVFAGGAIIAGLPFGCAASAQEAFEAMFNESSTPERVLGDRVRAASRHRGPWPRVSVWHGSADPVVRPSNAEEIVGQWTNVHGLSTSPTYLEKLAGHIRRVWNDSDGNTVVEAFSIGGMAHGVPVATGKSDRSCGAPGPFFLDVGISSTHHIAKFWGLANVGAKARSSAARDAPGLASDGVRSREVEVIVPGSAASEAMNAPFNSHETHSTRPPLDPNDVIAAAFKAAGLPSPAATIQPRGARVAPGPIIEAALKAAGLLRN
jgi:poly(hydroxyalkanoate) depolymerase family esterase